MTDPNQPMNKKDAKAEAAASKAYSKAQRPWVARHKILTGLAVFFLIGIIGSVAGGSSGGRSTNTSTSDPLTAATDSPTPDATTAAPVAAPTKPGKPSDKGWVLESFQVKDDGLGDFGGTARITNTNTDPQTTAAFTITLARGGTQIASLMGAATSVASGKTVTVQLISQDKFSKGAVTSDFQTDTSFAA